MATSKEYRQRADECLQLANEATEVYVRVALAELAAEFQKTAEEMESGPDGADPHKRATHKRATHKHAA